MISEQHLGWHSSKHKGGGQDNMEDTTQNKRRIKKK
jgi:hypothetical protein